PAPRTIDHFATAKIHVLMDPPAAEIASEDPFIFRKGIQRLAQGEAGALQQLANSKESRQRLAALLAMRLKRAPADRALLDAWLTDADGAVRRAALQWIAEENL